MVRLCFVYDHERPELWQDGLFAALQELKTGFKVEFLNLQTSQIPKEEYDFLLGWGAWGSPVDLWMDKQDGKTPRGLCIAGNAISPRNMGRYDVLFYETKWYRPQISFHRNFIHAFGVNTNIYKPHHAPYKIWDYVSVGSFSLWKRHNLITNKPGNKLCIGQVQRGNMGESLSIVSQLLLEGVAVSDMVHPMDLRKILLSAKKVFIPADINGGGERAVLEARACGVEVEVMPDNPKLQELVKSEVYDHFYYAKQLKRGIELCL